MRCFPIIKGWDSFDGVEPLLKATLARILRSGWNGDGDSPLLSLMSSHQRRQCKLHLAAAYPNNKFHPISSRHSSAAAGSFGVPVPAATAAAAATFLTPWESPSTFAGLKKKKKKTKKKKIQCAVALISCCSANSFLLLPICSQPNVFVGDFEALCFFVFFAYNLDLPRDTFVFSYKKKKSKNPSCLRYGMEFPPATAVSCWPSSARKMIKRPLEASLKKNTHTHTHKPFF